MALPLETVVGLTTAALCAILAPIVYFAGPGRWANRSLALLLVLEGFADATAGFGYVDLPYEINAGFTGVFRTAALALPFAYLLILGTLDTPLTAPFRGRRARLAIAGAALAVGALGLLGRQAFFAGSDPWAGVGARVADMVIVATSVFGLVCAVEARRRTAPDTLARRRTTTFLWAFGVRDLGFALYGVHQAFSYAGSPIPDPLGRVVGGAPFYCNLVFVPLLAYGILRHQLLDVDLRLKWTIRRGTLAAVFGAVFFVVAQLVQNVTSTSLGVFGGAVAAGLLLFAIHPLQRAADRVADAAMPHVRATPEYLAGRKVEVYRAAVESAVEEGGIDAKERAILDRLQAKLGLPRQDATRVEAAVLAG